MEPVHLLRRLGSGDVADQNEQQNVDEKCGGEPGQYVDRNWVGKQAELPGKGQSNAHGRCGEGRFRGGSRLGHSPYQWSQQLNGDGTRKDGKRGDQYRIQQGQQNADSRYQADDCTIEFHLL